MKEFIKQENETHAQYASRINRGITDMIINDIDKISDFPKEQIKSILAQLDVVALEIVEEECQTLEQFEVCRIARNLIEEKQGQ